MWDAYVNEITKIDRCALWIVSREHCVMCYGQNINIYLKNNNDYRMCNTDTSICTEVDCVSLNSPLIIQHSALFRVCEN